MDNPLEAYISSGDAARILGIDPKSAGALVRHGKLPAVKIANRWLIPKAAVEQLLKTYVPKRGRPRTKRKYTKRSPVWFSNR